MMIQQQTLAVDDTTRAELKRISSLIYSYRNDPEVVKRLIAEQDEIIKRAPACPYDPREEAK